LKITTKDLGNRQLELTIEAEDEAPEAMKRAARQIASQTDFPGFRKGKAPYELVAERYGEETIRREAADLVAEKAYKEALDQEGIDPIRAGTLDEIELDPLTLRFIIPLRPSIDLGDYRDFRLKFPKQRVKKQDVQAALERLQHQNAVLEPAERPAELDDAVLMSIKAETAEGQEVISIDEARVFLEEGSERPAPGFVEAVVGMEAGDERTFSLPLPDDLPQEELRGQDAEFKVRIKQVYDATLPPLDDDLARAAGNFDTFAKLEKHVREQIREAALESAEEDYAEEVLTAIVGTAEVEYPPVMLEEQLDQIMSEFEQEVKRQTKLSLDDFLRLQDKDGDEVRAGFEPQAEKRLKRALVLGEVVMQESLEVDDDDVDTEIHRVSAPWGVRADQVRSALNSEEGRQSVRSRLLGDKGVERLVAIAKGEAESDGE
jgi:trigger factor